MNEDIEDLKEELNEVKDELKMTHAIIKGYQEEELSFRTLKESEIDIRVGNYIVDKTTKEKIGFSLLLYKDARVDMDILDETVGKSNWQRDHKEIKNNMFCGVSIFTKGQWITKWDCGTESETEKEKGEASDSFKRACVNWGIGRELYTAPYIGIKQEQFKKTTDRFVVTKITYDNDRNISELVIKNLTLNKIVFTLKKEVNASSVELSKETKEVKEWKHYLGREAYQETAKFFIEETIDPTFVKSIWQENKLPENYDLETISKLRTLCFEKLNKIRDKENK